MERRKNYVKKEEIMSNIPECCYYKTSFCKFGEQCRYRHSFETTSCQFGDACQIGHPFPSYIVNTNNTLESNNIPNVPIQPVIPKDIVPKKDIAPKKDNAPRKEYHVKNEPKKDIKNQPFDSYLILDFEGKQEIIEFPVLLFDPKKMEVISQFHRYVKPAKIEEEKLNAMIKGKYGRWGLADQYFKTAIPFVQVIQEFNQWMKDNHILNFAFITCGNWDIKTQASKQCSISEIPLPHYFNRWINLKDIYLHFYNERANGMKEMLDGLSIPLEGNHHSGLDDTKNIAKVVKRIIGDGGIINITASREANGRISFVFEDRIGKNSFGGRQSRKQAVYRKKIITE